MKIDVLENFIHQTWWMAARYADGRSTYAPFMFNEAMLAVKKNGFESLVEPSVDDRHYVRDGMLGEWDPKTRRFTGVPPEGKDMAHHRDAHARECDLKNLPRWVNKKTGKVYHVLSEAEDATNGELEGRRVVIYFDEMRTYVRDKEEFDQKFVIEDQA